MEYPAEPVRHVAVATTSCRYRLKPDPHSSHSVLLEWLGEGHGRRLLDVGAADGLLSRHLTDRGWRVTAVEGDAEVAKVGQAHCERMVVADLDADLPELGGPFDVIVYGDVLEHLVNPLATLERINALLVPGGRVAVSVPNVAHLLIRLSLLVGRFDYFDRGILDRTHLRFFTERSLQRLLAAAGLVVVRRTATAVPIYHVVPPWWHGRALAAVHEVSAALSRALPRLLGYQFVVAAECGHRDGRTE
jgi:2-polyprenyl-3-methyl-5-hydroxy-6-metoxy-1,4-benzoquinol methylase